MNIVVGYRQANFKGRDGQEIRGCMVYLGEEIAHNGAGLAVERLYLSDRRAEAMGVNLADLVGKRVVVMYDRRGRIASITVTD